MLTHWYRTSYGVLITQDYGSQQLRSAALNTDWRTSSTNGGETGTPTAGILIENVSFHGTNNVTTKSSATMVEVLCNPGECKGTWDWSGLKTSGGREGTNVGGCNSPVSAVYSKEIFPGGAPITGYTF